VSVVLKWIRSRRRPSEPDPVPEARETDRDSGEEEYESHEESADEVPPSGMTRVKTDDL
jgi:hypothetical protein